MPLSRLLVVLSALLTLGATAAPAEAPLKVRSAVDGTDRFKITEAGIIEITGPHSIIATPPKPKNGQNLVLSMDYFCIGGMPTYAILPGPPFEAKTARYLPELTHSEAWTPYVARLSQPGKPLPAGWNAVRLDLPLPAGRVLQLRNMQIRAERPGDFKAKSSRPSASSEQALRDYLNLAFPATIESVELTESSVIIRGSAPAGEGQLMLADIPMDLLIEDPACFETLVAIQPTDDGRFETELPRTRKRSSRDYDRLTSRWQLVRRNGKVITPISHARYAEKVACIRPGLGAEKPRHKKGLGGWSHGRLPNELEELDISAVTVNIMAHTVLSPTAGPGTRPFKWQGRTYHANEKVLQRYDKTLIEAAKHKAVVSGVLLVSNPARGGNAVVRKLGHPDAVKEGTYAHPDVVSEEGIGIYGAIINLMTERWTRPDGKYGRLHHWIIHNEVDAAWTWTNVGEKPALVFMDLHQRSMRLVDLISRQYDPHSRPFISLTHHWAKAGNPRFYGSRQMLDLLATYCRVEGDFPWALAYHPYPQSLRVPTTWKDHQATFEFETDKVTPHNLEVLDAYMKLPRFLHQGQIRPIHLTENGFNSPTYSAKDLTEQAAGMAYAWKKMAKIESIEVWHYHNWIDNRREGGLRIGLRKFPDFKDDPYGKKPIWHLYKAFATPREDAVAAPYLKTIGIESWDAAHHTGPIR